MGLSRERLVVDDVDERIILVVTAMHLEDTT